MVNPNGLCVKIRVYNLRVMLHMTQKEFCEKTGITEPSFSRLQSSKAEWNIGHLYSISQAFGVSLDWLTGLIGDDKKPIYIKVRTEVEPAAEEPAKPEDEQIAEYVRERYPYMLKTVDYKMFTMGADSKNMISTLASGLMEFI